MLSIRSAIGYYGDIEMEKLLRTIASSIREMKRLHPESKPGFAQWRDRREAEAQLVDAAAEPFSRPRSAPERALALAGVLQSIALPLHVLFRDSKLDPERAKQFWEGFERSNFFLSPEQFNRVRVYCQSAIQKMVTEFVQPSWTRTPDPIPPQMTFPDFVEAVTRQAAQLAKTFSEPIKASVRLGPDQVSLFEHLLAETGLVSELDSGDRFTVVERKPWAALTAIEQFGRELHQLLVAAAYDPWVAPLGDPRDAHLRLLAALVTGLCREVYLRRDRQQASFHPVADAIEEYVTPLWQRMRADLLALHMRTIAPDLGFREFVRAFNELVAAILDEALRELGDFAMQSYPLDDPAAEEVSRLAPTIQLTNQNGRIAAESTLSQFAALFRRASDELKGQLEQVGLSSTSPSLP
jgi:hypothetical protein